MKMNEYAEKWGRKLFLEDAEIDFKIKSGTEMYRKGFGRFKLSDSQGNPVDAAEISLQQVGHEYNFGCNAFMLNCFPEEEKNDCYKTLFADLFNLAVLPFFWSDLEPEPGQCRFGVDSSFRARRPPIDSVLDFCRKYQITPKGHPLGWHNFQPDWISKNATILAEQYENRFKTIAAKYGDQIKIWDVVNEAQTWSPMVRNNGITMPDHYVQMMFKMAERYFPITSKFTYNDDRVWFNYQREDSPVYLLVKSLLEKGLSVKGLGLQFHMANYVFEHADQLMCPRNIYKCLDLYASLNIPVNFSEVSIIARDELGNGEEFQALVAEKLYRLWFAHPATDGIIWWNMVDNTGAWESSNSLKAGVVNCDLSKKPVYNVLSHLIKNEWNTQTGIAYHNGSDNSFHGFYGTYKVKIKINAGVIEDEISLSKHSSNDFCITLPA